MSACAREANRQSKRSPLACVNFSSSSTLCFDAKLIGLLQTPSYHCALPVDFADSLPRAPPARSQTTIPSAPPTEAFSLRPLMYFLSGLDSSACATSTRPTFNHHRHINSPQIA